MQTISHPQLPIFAAKKIFRDFIGKYHVSERSFDQITRILGILGEVHEVVDVAMQEKDREIEKLKELLEIKENSLHENTGSGLSPRHDRGAMMNPAMQEYKQLLELCKVRLSCLFCAQLVNSYKFVHGF